jgi:eukaryotic-like serine/threonine-protein kinase
MDIQGINPSTHGTVRKTRPKKAKPQEGGQSVGGDVFKSVAQVAGQVLDSAKAGAILFDNSQLEGDRLDWTYDTKDRISDGLFMGTDGAAYVMNDLEKLTAINGKTGEQNWMLRNRVFRVKPVETPNGTIVFWGGEHEGKYAVFGVDSKTGNQAWRNETTEYGISALSIGKDGTAFICHESPKMLQAVDGATGKEKWKIPIDDKFQEIVLDDNGSLFCFIKEKIRVLDAKSGKKKFDIDIARKCSKTFTWPAELLGSPDGSVLLIDFRSGIASLDGTTGKKKWEFTAEGNIGGMSGKAAAGPDGTIYFGPSFHKLYALDGKTGEKKWEFPVERSACAAPFVGDDGIVYVGCYGNSLYALDALTGEKKWEWKTSDSVTSIGRGLDGTIVVAESGGKVYSLITDETRLKEKKEKKEIIEAGQSVEREEEFIDVSGIKLPINKYQGLLQGRMGNFMTDRKR